MRRSRSDTGSRSRSGRSAVQVIDVMSDGAAVGFGGNVVKKETKDTKKKKMLKKKKNIRVRCVMEMLGDNDEHEGQWDKRKKQPPVRIVPKRMSAQT
jgi:hypothetical protein